jgi:hypothetical protein
VGRDPSRARVSSTDQTVEDDPLAIGACRRVPTAAADFTGLYWLAEERNPRLGSVPMTATEIAVAIGGERRKGSGR